MARALFAALALALASCSESLPEPDRDATVTEDIAAIRAAVDEYASDHDGALPGSLEVLLRPDEQGRHYLRTGTPGIHDPWGKRYVYAPAADGTYRVRRAD